VRVCWRPIDIRHLLFRHSFSPFQLFKKKKVVCRPRKRAKTALAFAPHSTCCSTCPASGANRRSPDHRGTDEAGVLRFSGGKGVSAEMGYRTAGQWARHDHAITYYIDYKITRSEAPIPTFSIAYSRFDKLGTFSLSEVFQPRVST
jgi:hypothetical protein